MRSVTISEKKHEGIELFQPGGGQGVGGSGARRSCSFVRFFPVAVLSIKRIDNKKRPDTRWKIRTLRIVGGYAGALGVP